MSMGFLAMVASIVDFLGHGCFTSREAAAYSHSTRKMVTRWLDRYEGAIPRQMDPGADRFVTFLDFIQTLSVRQLRQNYQIPMQRIRQAAEVLREDHQLAHPFAREHKLYVFDRDIVYKRVVDGALIQVSGKNINQHLLKPVIQPHLDRLAFDERGLARAYTINPDPTFSDRDAPRQPLRRADHA